MLSEFLQNYFSIIIFLFIAMGLSVGFIFLNFFAITKKNQILKNCQHMNAAFEAFGDSRMEFDIRFYLVAILFYYI